MQVRRQVRDPLVVVADVGQKTQEQAASQRYARGAVRIQDAEPQSPEKVVYSVFMIVMNVAARAGFSLYQARGETDEQRAAFVNPAVEKYRFDRAADQGNFGGLRIDPGAGPAF